MPETEAREDAFESLRQFADVWHDKYAKPASAGENRKPPSLTMRANDVAAVLTEPQLGAVVAEYERMQTRVAELEAHPWQLVQAAQDEQDADVLAVVEACAGVVDGTEPQPYRHEYAVRRLRIRFADRIAAWESREAASGGVQPNGDPIWEEQ